MHLYPQQCDLAVLLNLLSFPLNQGQPCDSLWPIGHGRTCGGPQLSLDFKALHAVTCSLGTQLLPGAHTWAHWVEDEQPFGESQVRPVSLQGTSQTSGDFKATTSKTGGSPENVLPEKTRVGMFQGECG